MMEKVVKEKLNQCSQVNNMIFEKLQMIKEARKPVLAEIEDIPQQNYKYEPIVEPHTKDYLRQVKKQVKQIDEEIKVINQKADKFEKKYDQEQRKRESDKLFKKPVIKTRQQIEQEKKQKEEKRLDDFVNRIVEKYEPYLKKPEQLKEADIRAKNIYQQQFQNFQMKKHQSLKQEKGLSSKQKKEFDLVTKKDNWVLTQKSHRQVENQLVEDFITKNDVEVLEEESKSIKMKKEKEKRKKEQQLIFYKILDEKCKLDQKIFKKNFSDLVKKIFRAIDKQKTGYVSKEEMLQYFKDYNIFIDIFEINWLPFKEFVIKVKAKRKGLLNKQELTEILLDSKLHSKLEVVAERIQKQNKEEYQLPEFEQDDVQNNIEVVEVQQEQNDRDPEIDYQQLEAITQINQQFQDSHYPIYHQDLEQKKINCQLEIQEKQKQKRLDPEFIVFNNQIGELVKQYNNGQLKYQSDEDFIIDSQLYLQK